MITVEKVANFDITRIAVKSKSLTKTHDLGVVLSEKKIYSIQPNIMILYRLISLK